MIHILILINSIGLPSPLLEGKGTEYLLLVLLALIQQCCVGLGSSSSLAPGPGGLG